MRLIKMLQVAFVLLLVSNITFAADKAPEMQIEKLNDTMYLHVTSQDIEGFGVVSSNGLVVIEGTDAYLLDTPWSAMETEALHHWIQQHGWTLKASISTHFHADRAIGIEYLNSQDIPTYASQMTNELLKAQNKPQATHTFDDESFWLLKDDIEVYYPGPGHTQDNHVVWLPQHKVLLGGCFVRSQQSFGLGNIADANVKDWPASSKRLIKHYPDVQTVIPGHGRVGGPELLQHTAKMTTEFKL